jgi:hypothetical protein
MHFADHDPNRTNPRAAMIAQVLGGVGLFLLGTG